MHYSEFIAMAHLPLFLLSCLVCIMMHGSPMAGYVMEMMRTGIKTSWVPLLGTDYFDMSPFLLPVRIWFSVGLTWNQSSQFWKVSWLRNAETLWVFKRKLATCSIWVWDANRAISLKVKIWEFSPVKNLRKLSQKCPGVVPVCVCFVLLSSFILMCP